MNNQWAIYSADTARSYFRGMVGINDNTPSEYLDVAGNVRADSFIEYSASIPEKGLEAILGMRNKPDGTLDHKSFPSYTSKVVSWEAEYDSTGKLIKEAGSKVKEGVCLNSQIKYLIRAVQELSVQNDSLRVRIKKLERR